MKIQDTIVIAKDFAPNLGARYRTDGDHSGQEFLEDILLPRFTRAVAEGYKILIDLDGARGYPSSFVSGSFGKLSLDYGAELILTHVELKADLNPLNIEKILREVKNPRRQQV